ncbi:MAG TPA: hypothetical protein VGD12_15030 [Blastococcus sp.]|jgi:hypothetical protein
MNGGKLLTLGAAVFIALPVLVGCGSDPKPSDSAQLSAGGSAGAVLPVEANPIANTSTNPVLEVTYAALENNVDPATGKAVEDCLELTLHNTGPDALTDVEVYYEMTDVTTGQREGYHQTLDGLEIPAGGEKTVFFDNQTGPGHYPENTFSLYRSSVNQVDVAVQVSATGAKIATVTVSKEAGSGEKAGE